MSYDAGRIEPQFVYPREAAPIGLGPMQKPAFLRDRAHRTGRAASARRTSKLRRLLPIVFALLAALVFVTLTEGGRSARQAAPITSYLGHILERLGLGLTEITMKGQRMTRDSEVYDRLQLTKRHSIWLLDTDAARKRIETLPWVLKASLKRVFPDRLHIDIQERTPRAIWSDGRQTKLLDVSGRVLGPPVKGRFQSLPMIFGIGAAPHADAVLRLINRMPALRSKVGLYEWTANRRWTLHLKSGRQVLLPATGQGLALKQLTKGRLGHRLLDSNFEKLDMRVASQAAIEFRQ